MKDKKIIHKFIKTYPIVCKSCGGSGQIDSPDPGSITTKIICPACRGIGSVICTEEYLTTTESDSYNPITQQTIKGGC